MATPKDYHLIDELAILKAIHLHQEKSVLETFGFDTSTCASSEKASPVLSWEKMARVHGELRAAMRPVNHHFAHMFEQNFAPAVEIHVLHTGWPKVPNGTETVRFDAHPFVKWLSRWLPVTPYIEAEYPRYRDADPFMLEGRLHMSPAQEAAFRRELECKPPYERTYK